MEFRNLSGVSTSDLVACLHRSFSDYFVPVNAPVDFWEARWKRGRVDYGLSFGAFEEGALVGFILNGIDEGTAFNLVSGVVPEHRGRRIIQQLYRFAIPVLEQHHVNRCALEVITKNERAIRAYRSVGFTVVKEYKCYSGTLVPAGEPNENYLFRKVETVDWARYAPLRTYEFSWENSDAALQHFFEGLECWELVTPAGSRAGYTILNPQTGFIAQLGAAQEAYRDHLQELLQAVVRNGVTTVKINNVAAGAADTIAVLEGAGLHNYLDQYEMALFLTPVAEAVAALQLSAIR